MAVVRVPAFCTPRSDMPICSASTTTNPLGWSCVCRHSAICIVIRSWICSSRANSSTTRASFDRPTIRSPGR